jgi:hypothetical protein
VILDNSVIVDFGLTFVTSHCNNGSVRPVRSRPCAGVLCLRSRPCAGVLCLKRVRNAIPIVGRQIVAFVRTCCAGYMQQVTVNVRITIKTYINISIHVRFCNLEIVEFIHKSLGFSKLVFMYFVHHLEYSKSIYNSVFYGRAWNMGSG